MPQKHPQPPQHPKHPQHPLSAAANENSSRVNLWNQVDPGWLYKQAQGSRVKESTKRSRRDYSSGPSPHSRACKGPDMELVPQPQTHRGCTQAGPQGGAISLPQSGCHSVSHHPQSPPRSACPDLVLEVGLEPPSADLTSCISCEELPPVILEIPSSRRNFLETLNHASALTRLVSGSDLPLGALRDQGHPHHPPLAILGSTSPPSGGGVSNGNTEYRERCSSDPLNKAKPSPSPTLQ